MSQAAYNQHFQVAYRLKAGDKLLSIVGSTSLFLSTTSLFLFNKAEIDNMLNQQCWAI